MNILFESAVKSLAKILQGLFLVSPKGIRLKLLNAYTNFLKHDNSLQLSKVRQLMAIINSNGGFDLSQANTPEKRQKNIEAQLQFLAINDEMDHNDSELNLIPQTKIQYCGI